MDSTQINRDGIARAYQAIRGHIRRTPTVDISADELGLSISNPVILKLELLQHTGSFKARGAFTHMVARDMPKTGIAAASGGNHGAAVAFAARQLGYKATVFVPEIVSPAKLALIRQYGAELVIHGDTYADAAAKCAAFVAEAGAMEIHAYDQPETLIGQGTIGLELETQSPRFKTILAAVGGGGLIGGLMAWLQHRASIIAVEPRQSCALHAALQAGKPIDVEVGGIAADSLGARRVGKLMFPLAQAFVEDSVLVEDAAIRKAQSVLWDRLRIVAEPGGATALAALVSGAYQPEPGEPLCVVVCGGNAGIGEFPVV